MTNEHLVAETPAFSAEPTESCHGGKGELSAAALVAAPPEEVFAFLADLENHWALADRFIEVLELSGTPGARDGGRVRMHGPLGLGRTARTRVEAAHPTHLMIGAAEMGRRSRACVSWTLTPSGRGTSVRLTATLDQAGLLDRFLLLLGGRWWMRRRFVAVVRNLADRFGSASSPTGERRH
ncbi:MAG TPA: SRPBCC family protein [Solirubrobacterales bacterium]|nr:SRPBCC family protein [Solirubrobacterales bacterium]